MFRSGHPPSTDIGLNSNILNLILEQGNLPTWNPYHMGGEPLTNQPGFHFFATFVVMFTGMPILSALMVIAAFFSSFVVFPAYLIARRLWRSSSTGILAAFFVTVSSLSFEMLGWGGYPNIVTLFLITAIVYLFLRNHDHAYRSDFMVSGLLLGSLLLTHLLSFFVLTSVLVTYIIVLSVGYALKHKRISQSLRPARLFVVSIVLGILLISPWLVRVSNFYLDMASQGVFFGGMTQNKNLLFSNRAIDVSILFLSGAVVLIFFMLKASRGRYVDSQSLLFVVWFLVPLFLTQSYLVNIITDYQRFVYFVDFPSLIILSAGVFYILRYVSTAVKKYSVGKYQRYEKISLGTAFAATILIIYLTLPLMITPSQTLYKMNFYTTINNPEANAMNWIQQRTSTSAVLVADHLYGWWLSGVAQRSTLSAVPAEFLLYPYEIDVAKAALMLLDTDYYIDNGVIQVREDGGFISRRNPVFGIDLPGGIPRHLFYFKDTETTIYYQTNQTKGTLDLSEMNMTDAHWISRNDNSAVLAMTRENNLFTIDRTLRVERGANSAELSYQISPRQPETSINWVRFMLHTIEGNIVYDQNMLGFYDPLARVCGEVIFRSNNPEVKMFPGSGGNTAELLYTNENDSSIEVKFLFGFFDAEKMSYSQILDAYDRFMQNPQQIVSNLPLITYDYLEIIKDYDVSYVVCRDPEMYPKFSNDPHFQVAYSNEDVTIFRVIEPI